MKILVIGGTGKVGLRLVERLLEGQHEVTVLSRSNDRSHLVPTPARVAVSDVVADPQGARALFKGLDAVFMLNKATVAEAVEGTMAVRLAQESGVPRFVYQTVHLLDDLAYLPHLAAKFAIRRAIELSGMDYTFIAPNHFFQNTEMVRRPLLEQDVYLTPLGPVGCSSVDADDIAEAAAIVLQSEGHSGRTYNIVGPAPLTSAMAAAIWSTALGRDIRAPATLDQWREFTRPFMPAWMHYDLDLMYQDFAQRGMLGAAEDVAQVTALLGRPPRSYEDYASERAAHWRIAKR